MRGPICILGALFGFVLALVARRLRSGPPRGPVPPPKPPDGPPPETPEPPGPPGVDDEGLPPDEGEQGNAGDTSANEGPNKPGLPPIPPEKHGGRHRGRKKKDGSRTKTPTQPAPRVGLVCFGRDSWSVGLEVEPADTGSVVEVTQGGNPLSPSRYEESTWLLDDLQEPIQVSLTGSTGPSVHTIKLVGYAQHGAFPFRLSPRDPTVGRYSRHLSGGLHVIFAPSDWSAADPEVNPPHSECEDSVYPGYVCHFYDMAAVSGGELVFDSEEGTVRLRCGKQHYVPEGYSSAVVSAEGPRLFLGRAPVLVDTRSEPWSDVGTIVVGEDGPGGNKWRDSFHPAPGEGGQALEGVVPFAGGWFFARFYDQAGTFLESFDFCFHTGLKDIIVSPEEHMPATGGYSSTTIDFVHSVTCEVVARGERATDLPFTVTPTRTTVTLPSQSEFDRSGWTLRSDDGVQIDFALDLGRTWWSLERPGSEASWAAQPVSLGRDDLGAWSQAVLRLRIPRCLGARHVACRFEGGVAPVPWTVRGFRI